MDPVRNPYAPGAGSSPPALTGRDEQIEAFAVLIERLRHGRTSKSLMVTGLRGVGKTVLLNRFRDMAENAGFKSSDAEITHETDFRATMARLARRIILALSPVERAKDRVWQAARLFKAFTLKLPDGYEIGMDVEMLRGKADSGNLAEDLADLFIALGEAASERNSGVVLLLDEIQFLDRPSMEALIAATHHVVQRTMPLTVVGAGLPQLPKLAGEAKSYAERLFDFPVIDKLEERAAREALEQPARSENVSYQPEATTAILEFTRGYPYFLQEYGKHVWNLAQGTVITRADVEAALPVVIGQLDENFFRVRIDRVTPAERNYISAMAALGAGPYRSGDIADRLGRPMTAVSPLRGGLINKGIIYSPAQGITDFTVPQFDDFLRRNHPYRTS